MAGSTSKKVVVHRFDREPLQGFLNPQASLLAGGVELLSITGSITLIPYEEVKVVCFVRDFESSTQPLQGRVFHNRPKTEGLWVRMQFRDGEFLDGILANELLQLEPRGFTIIPPEASADSQRVFVPREALVELKVLGVVGTPLRQRKAKAPGKDQIGLFE